ncbi:MAG: type II secretion system protein [Terriglobales bacterium]
MSTPRQKSQEGFSLLELAIVCAILLTVLGAVFSTIAQVTQRSQAEQVKIDLTQQAREFVDEFQRDLHQAGYPNCRMIKTPLAATNCPPDYTNALVAQNSAVAAGLVSVSNTQIVFEGDVDGDGVVDTVWYRLVDQAGNYPPTGTCPCTIQRSQMQKQIGVLPLAQPTTFSQALQNVVNSGVVAGTTAYGTGLPISGGYYTAVSNFNDYPVFTAYDEYGAIIQLPLDLSTPLGQQTIPTIKSVRLTINLLANATTGVDMKTHVRPVETLVGNARLVNCGGQPCD